MQRKRSRARPSLIGRLSWRARLWLVLVLCAAVAYGLHGYYLADVRERFLAFTARTGLVVQSVRLTGVQYADRAALIQCIGPLNTPMLALDLHASRTCMLGVAWVEDVWLSRAWPDAVVATIHERRPVAVLEENDQYFLIDAKGESIARLRHKDAAPGLLIVSGSGVIAHLPHLYHLLDPYPDVAQALEKVTWVGGRRWNLYTTNGTEIRLPEESPETALAVLKHASRRKPLLDGSLLRIDLRFKGRLVLKPR